MTGVEQNIIKTLIPDLQSMDHVSLNTKRINFIYGQGAIIYNDIYAVEIYVPKNKNEDLAFFAVDRHFGHIHKLGEYYRRIPVMKYDDAKLSSEMRAQFDEAVFLQSAEGGNVKEMYERELTKKVA